MIFYKECIKVLLICMVIGLPYITIAASRKDSACNIYNLEEKGCNIISNNYTEPYCITNLYHNDRDASDVNYAESCIWPSLTNNISSIQKKDKKVILSDFTTRDIVEQYCLSLLGNSDTGRIYFARPSSKTNSWDWQQTFDSHQSLFLYALCSSFTEKGEKPFINGNATIGDAYKEGGASIIKDLGLKQKGQNKSNLCSLDEDYGIIDCDMAIYAAKIYAGIMSDLFKIKYAQVLHVDDSKNYEKEKKVEDFMNGYYLMNDTYANLKANYPKTIPILESNQQYYKKVLEKLKLIDNSKLVSLAKSSKCPIEKQMVGLDFIACALHSSQGSGASLTPSFVTLFYNETLHYRQFVSFYENRLNQKIALMSKNQESEKDVRILESKITDFKLYFDIQMEASEQVQRNFEEFNMTYPLHIWILLYIEKAEKFRNTSLSKIISSFYSLSEKLQNVQEPLS